MTGASGRRLTNIHVQLKTDRGPLPTSTRRRERARQTHQSNDESFDRVHFRGRSRTGCLNKTLANEVRTPPPPHNTDFYSISSHPGFRGSNWVAGSNQERVSPRKARPSPSYSSPGGSTDKGAPAQGASGHVDVDVDTSSNFVLLVTRSAGGRPSTHPTKGCCQPPGAPHTSAQRRHHTYARSQRQPAWSEGVLSNFTPCRIGVTTQADHPSTDANLGLSVRNNSNADRESAQEDRPTVLGPLNPQRCGNIPGDSGSVDETHQGSPWPPNNGFDENLHRSKPKSEGSQTSSGDGNAASLKLTPIWSTKEFGMGQVCAGLGERPISQDDNPVEWLSKFTSEEAGTVFVADPCRSLEELNENRIVHLLPTTNGMVLQRPPYPWTTNFADEHLTLPREEVDAQTHRSSKPDESVGSPSASRCASFVDPTHFFNSSHFNRTQVRAYITSDDADADVEMFSTTESPLDKQHWRTRIPAVRSSRRLDSIPSSHIDIQKVHEFDKTNQGSAAGVLRFITSREGFLTSLLPGADLICQWPPSVDQESLWKTRQTSCAGSQSLHRIPQTS